MKTSNFEPKKFPLLAIRYEYGPIHAGCFIEFRFDGKRIKCLGHYGRVGTATNISELECMADNLSSATEKLLAQHEAILREAMEALEFYAESKNHSLPLIGMEETAMDKDKYGGRARETLAKLKAAMEGKE